MAHEVKTFLIETLRKIFYIIKQFVTALFTVCQTKIKVYL